MEAKLVSHSRASAWLSSLALENGAQLHLASTNKKVMLQVFVLYKQLP